MIAVIFDVEPADAETQTYLDIAADLRPLLDQIEGFISVERFESLSTPGKYLSLSFWRDEQAVAIWRQTVRHRAAQGQGRTGLFKDYRLRVASVIRDYSLNDREQAPRSSGSG
ncbi:antibiotic biosynthesis monooxygenase family protein [Ruegeria conchae]|uniref:Heme-degrading monooxygenase HmoA n=1 Tax=Ruegeria conchae TaxID=981384 RepID=A0A497YUW8_9RHOB|nr:antibiotic biosynthesis monooxygenase [Ruegeria conchae]RLJ99868.1 heme-degrading monooxygenase HmoA [Ruegeria conchae]